MKIKKWSISAIFFLLLSLCTWQVEIAKAVQPVPSSIEIPGLQAGFATDGKIVAWSNSIPEGSSYGSEIYAVRLSDGLPFLAVSKFGRCQLEALSGDILVWRSFVSSSRGDSVYAKNLATDEVISVGRGGWATVSGDWIVWYGSPSDTEPNAILAYNIRTKAPAIKVANTKPFISNIQVNGDKVFWQESSTETNQKYLWQLYTVRIGDSTPTLLVQAVAGTGGISFDFQNDLLVYSINRKLSMRNLKTGVESGIAENSGGAAIDGRYIFWGDIQFLEQRRVDIKGYDLGTGSYFDVSTNNGINAALRARNDTLVWAVGQPNKLIVYAAKIADILPSARQTGFVNSEFS